MRANAICEVDYTCIVHKELNHFLYSWYTGDSQPSYFQSVSRRPRTRVRNHRTYPGFRKPVGKKWHKSRMAKLILNIYHKNKTLLVHLLKVEYFERQATRAPHIDKNFVWGVVFFEISTIL